jgi:predicted ester cyclase
MAGSRTFPTGEFVVQDMVAWGDKVAARVEFHGTHLGDLATSSDPITATGRSVRIAGLVMYRFANDQIVETWGCWDILGLRAQLDAMSV